MDVYTKGLVTVLGLSGVLFLLALPLALGKVAPNRVYGFRTRTTFSREAAWYAVNSFYGRCQLAASLLSAVGAVVVYRFFTLDPRQHVHWTVLLLVVPQTAAIVAGLVYQRRFRERA